MEDLDPSDFANLRVDVVEEKLGAREADAKAASSSKRAGKSRAPPKEAAPLPAAAATKKTEAQEKKEEKKEEDAFKKRQKLLDKILQYREKFKSLKKRNNVGIKSSMDELLDEVHYIQQQLGSPDDSQDNPACMALIAGMFGAEWLTQQPGYNPLNLKLQGLGQTTQANIESFEPLLDEFMIKHGASIVLSVEWRLCLMIGTTVMTVHAANNGMDWPGKIVAAQQLAEQKVAAQSLGKGL